jgi:hypothetical protein
MSSPHLEDHELSSVGVVSGSSPFPLSSIPESAVVGKPDKEAYEQIDDAHAPLSHPASSTASSTSSSSYFAQALRTRRCKLFFAVFAVTLLLAAVITTVVVVVARKASDSPDDSGLLPDNDDRKFVPSTPIRFDMMLSLTRSVPYLPALSHSLILIPRVIADGNIIGTNCTSALFTCSFRTPASDPCNVCDFSTRYSLCSPLHFPLLSAASFFPSPFFCSKLVFVLSLHSHSCGCHPLR